MVVIKFKQADVIFYSFKDSISYTSWQTRDSSSASMSNTIYHLPVSRITQKAKLKKWEKDSMYYWVKSMIAKPIRPGLFCTDYVGYVKFMVVSNQVEQSCSYSSVCEWQLLSSNTEKINVLIKSKFNNF
jgi:hypothetical protein